MFVLLLSAHTYVFRYETIDFPLPPRLYVEPATTELTWWSIFVLVIAFLVFFLFVCYSKGWCSSSPAAVVNKGSKGV